MKHLLKAPLVVSAILFASCDDPIPPEAVDGSIVVACSLTKLILSISDSQKISNNFGEGSAHERICELFLGGGYSAPVPSGGEQVLEATLPDGSVVTARASRI